jgi:hypothetical protein
MQNQILKITGPILIVHIMTQNPRFIIEHFRDKIQSIQVEGCIIQIGKILANLMQIYQRI